MPKRKMTENDWMEVLEEAFSKERVEYNRLNVDEIMDEWAKRKGSDNKAGHVAETIRKVKAIPEKPSIWDAKPLWDFSPEHAAVDGRAHKEYIRNKCSEEYNRCMNENIGNPGAQNHCKKWQLFSENYSYGDGVRDHFKAGGHGKKRTWDYYKWVIDNISQEDFETMRQRQKEAAEALGFNFSKRKEQE